MSLKPFPILLLMISTLTHASMAAADVSPADQCRFIGIRAFTGFAVAPSSNANQRVLLSPVIKAPINWDELVVSWNAAAPAETWLKVEARGIYPDHETKFYTMGFWSRDSVQHPRHSVRRQKDADGRVNDDTLVLARQGADVQLRLTLGSPIESRPHSGSKRGHRVPLTVDLDSAGALFPQLKFLGLSFLDSHAQPAALPPHRAVWGKIVTTPERSQHSYPQEKGWCSPTSLSMVLTRWGEVLQRPELNLDVPEVAAGVYDRVFGGTGNWPFNTAYAGSFPGLRAYVARFSGLSEVEDWIAAGLPVILSARWDLLAPGRNPTGSGHLVVCIGFTETGDVVINDPATNFKKGQKVRHIYTRERVINAWKESNNTVYLVYPETARIPADRFGHWDKP